MNELAKQAFETQNFDLSAEIIQRSIIEEGPTTERYLCLGDSYARGGHLTKAFDSYSKSLQFGDVQPQRLQHLVTILVDTMSQKEEIENLKRGNNDIFACLICKSLWTDPITLKCGHTFCKLCLERDESCVCKSCGYSHKLDCIKISNIKTNVLLAQSIQKWFSVEIEGVKFKSKGTECFKNSNYREAVEYFTKAISAVPEDHLLTSNRSYAFSCLGCYEEALSDAERTIQLQPDWPKGYFRKGAALTGLGRHEEAAFSYLQCLTLDQGVTTARNALAKALHKILSPVQAEEQLKLMSNSSGLYSSPYLHFPGNRMGLQNLSLNSLQHLKQSLHESLAQSAESRRENPLIKAPDSCASCPDIPSSAGQFDLTTGTDSHMVLSRTPSDSQLHKQMSIFGKNPSRKRSSHDRNQFLSKDDMEMESSRCSTPTKLARSETKKRDIAPELLVKDDFECSLCMRLLYTPVTTPCGHTFCRQCLDRCLDHSPQCPLCKSSLVEYLAERRSCVTEALEKILILYFPDEHEERKQQHEDELAELARMGSEQQSEVPIFVCTMAFPQLPCPLHIFEPRYRLMVRQVMEAGTRQFGMCLPSGPNESDFSTYGTMLEIRDVQYFPDGRSVVDCMGGRRFKVLERSTRDGYNTAKVEFLVDTPVTTDADRQSLQKLHDQLHSEASSWYNNTPPAPRAQIVRHFGAFPDVEQNPLNLPNGPTWHWWLCAVLPLDPRAQISILSMRTLAERLKALTRVLHFLMRKTQ